MTTSSESKSEAPKKRSGRPPRAEVVEAVRIIRDMLREGKDNRHIFAALNTQLGIKRTSTVYNWIRNIRNGTYYGVGAELLNAPRRLPTPDAPVAKAVKPMGIASVNDALRALIVAMRCHDIQKMTVFDDGRVEREVVARQNFVIPVKNDA